MSGFSIASHGRGGKLGAEEIASLGRVLIALGILVAPERRGGGRKVKIVHTPFKPQERGLAELEQRMRMDSNGRSEQRQQDLHNAELRRQAEQELKTAQRQEATVKIDDLLAVEKVERERKFRRRRQSLINLQAIKTPEEKFRQDQKWLGLPTLEKRQRKQMETEQAIARVNAKLALEPKPANVTRRRQNLINLELANQARTAKKARQDAINKVRLKNLAKARRAKRKK